MLFHRRAHESELQTTIMKALGQRKSEGSSLEERQATAFELRIKVLDALIEAVGSPQRRE